MSRKELSKEIRVHEMARSGVILEVSFRGSFGIEFASEMLKCLKGAVEQHQPDALIVNLLEFRTSYTDALVGALAGAVATMRRLGGEPPCRVVAKGQTSKNLGTLLGMAKLLPLFGSKLHEDVSSAMADTGLTPRKGSGG